MRTSGRGHSTGESADALARREGTVRIYVHRVIRPLVLRNRVDVALCASRLEADVRFSLQRIRPKSRIGRASVIESNRLALYAYRKNAIENAKARGVRKLTGRQRRHGHVR